MVPIKKDQELFVSYGYNMATAPKWYRELYKQYAKENPKKADNRALKIIEDVELNLEKGDIQTW